MVYHVLKINESRFISLFVVRRCRGGSRTAATSKVELFVIIVNGWSRCFSVSREKPYESLSTYESLYNISVFLCPLVWMFHSKTMNSRINKLHEKALRLVYPFFWWSTERGWVNRWKYTKRICKSLQQKSIK